MWSSNSAFISSDGRFSKLANASIEPNVQNVKSFSVLHTNETTFIYIGNPKDMLDPFNSNQDFLTIVITHAITFFFGVIGNLIVIYIWMFRGKFRSPTATFLVSLACADLILLILMPFEVLEYFVITWDRDGYICKISSFVELLSGMASILNLVAVSVERFLVIVYPIKARRWCTVAKSRRSLAFVWFLAIALATPAFFYKSTYSMTFFNDETYITAYYCFEKTDNWAMAFAIYELLILFVIPAMLMVFCYFRVIRELWTSTRTWKSYQQANSTSICKTTAITCSSDNNRSYLVRWPPKKIISTNYEATNKKNANREAETIRNLVSSKKHSTLSDSNQTKINFNSLSPVEANFGVQVTSLENGINNHESDMIKIEILKSRLKSYSIFNYLCSVCKLFSFLSCCPKRSKNYNSSRHCYHLCLYKFQNKCQHHCHRCAHLHYLDHHHDNHQLNSRFQKTDNICNNMFHQEIKSCCFCKNHSQSSECSSKISSKQSSTVEQEKCCFCLPITPISIGCCQKHKKENKKKLENISPNEKRIQRDRSDNIASSPRESMLQMATDSSSNMQYACCAMRNNSSRSNKATPNVSMVKLDGNNVEHVISSKATLTPLQQSPIASPPNAVSSRYRTPVSNIRKARKQLYCQVIKMLLMIIFLYAGCWLPRLIFNLFRVASFAYFDNIAYRLRLIANILPFIHSALNPFVYGLMSSNFRRMLTNSCNSNLRSYRHSNLACPGDGPTNRPISLNAMATTNCYNMSPLKASFVNDDSQRQSSTSNIFDHISVTDDSWPALELITKTNSKNSAKSSSSNCENQREI